MKKILCVLVLTCLVLSAAFAQQQKPATPAQPAQPAKPAKPASPPPAAAKAEKLNNSLGLDLFQLFKGFIASDIDSKVSVFIISVGYEHLVAPHFSVGGDIDLYFMKFYSVDSVYFGLAAEGRYYPMSTNFEKFFLGTTLGINSLSVKGKTKAENGGFFGLTTSLKAGYKLIFNKNMYLEPSMAYVLSKSGGGGGVNFNVGDVNIGFSVPKAPTPLGWNGGLRLGILF
jgi:hypothetical protein